MVYDYIIVGSGHAGASFAKVLNYTKSKVLMIDYHDSVTEEGLNKKRFLSSRVHQSDYLHLTKKFIEKSKIISKNFNLICCLQKGGLSNIWGGGFLLDGEYVNRNKIKFNFKYFSENFGIKYLVLFYIYF